MSATDINESQKVFAIDNSQKNAEAYPTNLIGIFFLSPDSFQRLAKFPKIYLPILALLLITISANVLPVLKLGYEQYIRQDFEQSVSSGNLTRPEMEASIQMVKENFNLVTLIISLSLSEYLILLIAILCLTVWLKLVSNFANFTVDFKALLSIILGSWLIVSIIYLIVYALIILFQHPDDVNIGYRFLSSLDDVLQLLFGNQIPFFLSRITSWIDIFLLWKLLIISVGYNVIVSKVKLFTALAFILMPLIIIISLDLIVSLLLI